MQVIKKTQCPRCAEQGRDNNEDNLAVYQDDSVYCFSCGYYENEKVSDNSGLLNGNIQDIPNRGLSKDICSLFNYKVGKFSGFLGGNQVKDLTVQIATYCNHLGHPTGQKIRDNDKNMRIIGNLSDSGLYGQWLWEPNPKTFITIVEGEIDALTVAQETKGIDGHIYPVVSVKTGAQSAKSCLKKELEWLQKWKHVVLAFDNDEAGQKAIQECIELFEPGKVRVANWPLKDANEMLLNSRGNEIKTVLFNAIQIRPDGIVTYSDVADKVLEQPGIGLSWPWQRMTQLTYGIRPHELITIMGGSGLGKTELVSEIFLHLIQNHNVRCGVMSFEQPPHKTYQRAIGKLLNKRLHVPGADFDPAEINRLGKEVLDDKLFCYSRAGRVHWDDVRNKLTYYVKALDCKLIVIDNLSSIASKFDIDERKGIDRAMLELSELVMTLEITIILVCHVSRTDKHRTSFEEGGKVTLRDARGSEGIGQHSTYVFGLERNTLAEDEATRYITTVRCLKDREYGTARGQTIQLTFNPTNGRLEEWAI